MCSFVFIMFGCLSVEKRKLAILPITFYRVPGEAILVPKTKYGQPPITHRGVTLQKIDLL
jgi:hypothetical protein